MDEPLTFCQTGDRMSGHDATYHSPGSAGCVAAPGVKGLNVA
jgi:hypothetical protein